MAIRLDSISILDVRFIPNPFFVPRLRTLTGLDPQVRDYVMEQPESHRFVDEVTRLLEFLLPLYQREGKSYLDHRPRMHRRTPSLARAGAANRARACDTLGFKTEVRDHDISR